jgi:hypothetical protein
MRSSLAGEVYVDLPNRTCLHRQLPHQTLKFASPLSHEIRYVFSVHGGILIPDVAMLLRNVSLMVQVQAGI